jgi:hypothetical protein
MTFGLFLFVVGYALVYWGMQHFDSSLGSNSLWTLLGFNGQLFGKITMPKGTPVSITNLAQGSVPPGTVPPGTPTGGSQGSNTSPGYPQTPSGVPQIQPPCAACTQDANGTPIIPPPLGTICICGSVVWQLQCYGGQVQWMIVTNSGTLSPPFGLNKQGQCK